MPDYESMYFHLAGQVADAIDDLQLAESQPQKVIRYLQNAMREAEAQYVQDDLPE